MTLDEAIACEEKIVDGYEKIKKVKAITGFELFSANNHEQIENKYAEPTEDDKEE